MTKNYLLIQIIKNILNKQKVRISYALYGCITCHPKAYGLYERREGRWNSQEAEEFWDTDRAQGFVLEDVRRCTQGTGAQVMRQNAEWRLE